MEVGVRKAKPGDSEEVCQWTRELGWTTHSDDVAMLDQHLTNVQQFVAENVQTGEPLGIVSVANLKSGQAYVARYIVKKEYRGKGIGKQLWNVAMLQLSMLNLAIDSTGTMTNKYDEDFPIRSPVQTLRYMGRLLPHRLQPVNAEDKVRCISVTRENDIANWCRYHQAVTGVSANRQFWNQWHRLKTINSIIAYDQSGVAGIGSSMEVVNDRVKIGPLFAQNFETALRLLYALLANHPDKEAMFPVPSNNRPMLQFVQRHEMTLQLTLTRSYSKVLDAGADTGRMFCVTGTLWQPE